MRSFSEETGNPPPGILDAVLPPMATPPVLVPPQAGGIAIGACSGAEPDQ